MVDKTQFSRDLVADRRVNRFKLEIESSKQADLYGYWATELADAKEERDRLKTTCKKVEGQTEIGYRTGNKTVPKDKDGKPMKLTEASIMALINADNDVIVARDDLAAAEATVAYLAGAEEAMQHRRSSINGLIALWEKEYYSEMHSSGRPNKDAGNDMAGNNARKNLNKNKRDKE